MDNVQRKRILITFIGFIILFVCVLGKAFKIQVLDREELIARSHSQTLREVKVYPKRGNIYDRNQNPLAINIQTYSIFTIPKNLKGNSSYKKLSRIVKELPYSKILKKVKDRRNYTWLARKISLSDEQVQQIKKLNGVYIESVPKRLYPNNELLSQSLGFVGIDNSGLSGIEYLFDKELKGKPKILKYIKDAKGRPIKHTKQIEDNESHDITLTIDKDLQAIAEKYLKESVIENNANSGGIGVMDVKTGEILAVANYPTYNPNKITSSEAKYRKLSFVTDPIEPGSTFKIFTVASALENKIARGDTNFYCEKGRLEVEDHVIREAEAKKVFEWLSVKEIIKYSSNIGTTKIAFDLTYPKLKNTLKSFGIGEKTGVEIPGESRGIFDESDNVRPIKLSNISFGQGVATTGIQMLAAYAAIANNGVYVEPTIFKDKFKEKRVVISKKTASELEEMLIEAVDSGTGSNAKIPHFTIAGKTSTAQRPDSSGGYTGYVSGFIGYPVNVENRFVIYVYIDNPKGRTYYGNTVAAPVFKKVAQYMLYKDKNFSKLAIVKDTNKNIDRINFKQSSTRVYTKGIVPNFVGLDKKSTRKLAKVSNLRTIEKGIGVVSSQEPAPGEAITSSTIVNLIYEPPKID